MDEKKQQPQQISVEISPEQSEGIYSNIVLIAHSPSEFILDFARILPGLQKAKVFARILMTPQNACLLKDALDENLKKYEERFGKIKIFGKESKEIGFK
jgi:formyltetrahydrofolate hydrolase